MRALASWKIPFVCALTSVGVAFTLIAVLHSAHPAAAPAKAAKPAAVGAPVEISLNDALGRQWIEVSYHGNGREDFLAGIRSRSARPLRVTLSAGLVFEGRDSQAELVLARDAALDLAPAESRSQRLTVAATRASNVIGEQFFTAGATSRPVLDRLLNQIRACPEASPGAIQTAVLLVTENPALGVFAKFSLLSGDPPTGIGADAFRVNTVDILDALSLLKGAGYPRGELAVAQEPQLKIEAMIDPLAHAAAVRYYGITPQQEWVFWRDELTQGDASTRHYALYGIGRYYPDVALQMLPAWARQQNLSPIYRQSAIQALAETRRPEAISVLQQLINEFGANTELGRCARHSMTYLENRRNGVPEVTATAGVEFKLTQVEAR